MGLLSATLLVGACADFRRGSAADAAIEAALVDDPVFETDVYPILQSRCEDCHSKGREAELTRFVMTGKAKVDRAVVVTLVSPDNPDGSLLLWRASGNQHTGGVRIAEDEYPIIRSWIASLPAGP